MGKTLSNLDELMRWKHAIDKQNKKLSKKCQSLKKNIYIYIYIYIY